MAEQTKKVPQRKCTGCGIKADKKDLIRVVRTPEGEIKIDLKGKTSGRGAYICHSAACLRKAVKSKRLARNLEVEIPDGIYEALEVQLKGEN